MRAVSRDSDKEARQKALDTSASFAVQAPAGSGKTELLMQRYLALLALVEKPEQILALTFTRKAAGEMHSRILGAMQKARDGHEPEAEHEAKTIALAAMALERDSAMGWSLLENPNRLKVQTIDSFCSSIVRQMPVLSGLSRYSITDQPEEFYKEAAAATVALVEEDGPSGDAVRHALSHLENSVSGLMKRLVMMLGRRDQWLRHVERSTAAGELRTLLEGSLERLIDFELKSAANAMPPGFFNALAPLARYAASNMAETNSPVASLSGLRGAPQARASALGQWQGLRELMLTRDNKVRARADKNIGFPAGGGEAAERKKEFQEILRSIAEDDGVAKALGRVAILPGAKFLDSEWETLEAIISLLPIAEGMLAAAFGARGVVDFQQVSLAALKALGSEEEPTDLMLSLDLRIQHILVDEYQDTSHTQLALIEALTRGWTSGDGRTLFVVGDPMQSIYLFREADVGLFLEARLAGIGQVRTEPLTLSSNFRSQEALVAWVNNAMKDAFPAVEDTFTGAVSYSPSIAMRDEIEGRGVEVTLFEGKDGLAEAKKAVSILKSIPEGESVAILCRSRGNLDSIVEEIKKEGIKFCAQNIDPLSGRTAVRDLMALLRALDHPLDRVAWLACLRAPWCGLTLRDIHELCSREKSAPVWALLNDETRLSGLTDDGKERVARFVAEMKKALSIWGRRSPSDVLRGLWISLGGPACLEGAEDGEDAFHFLSLVESTESSGAVSVEELEERLKGLFADHPPDAGTRLSIMTIHKAKGLEFDNVIIPGMGKYARADEKKLLVWMERGEEDLLLAPIEKKRTEDDSRIYAYLSALQKEKAGNEDARLLYVAATRTRKSLYLLGHAQVDEDGRIQVDPRSFLAKIARVLRPDMITREKFEDAPGESGQPGLKRLPSVWTLPQLKEPLPSGGSYFTPESIEPQFYWAGEAIKHLGTAVHRFFCRISKEGLERWDAARIRGEAERMRSLLKSLGLGEAASKKAAAEGVDILIKALADERGRWTLSAHPEAASELPLTAVVNNAISRVVIDRTFVEDGTRWVIDFKTGSHAGGSLEEFLEHERERYRGQLMKYEAALRAYGETRPIRKGLYYPAHRAWVEV